MRGLIVAICLFAVLIAGIRNTKMKNPHAAVPGYKWGYATANQQYQVDYFYWVYAPVNGNKNAPLVLWLTGGPGCSSELAMFFENGPFSVNPDLSLKKNPFGWNAQAYLMYVDQPGGTGFSTVGNPDGYVTDENQVASDFFTFLQNFYAANPEFAKKPLYIVGESYAGHYVPAIAAYIVSQNAARSPNTATVPLRGIGIGNGFVDPGVQTASFGPFLAAFNLVTPDQLNDIQSGVAQCQQDIANGDYSDAFSDCTNVLETALEYCAENKGDQCNVYNVNAPCIGQLCYDMSAITNYLNQNSVQAALGVSGIDWEPCDSTPYSYLENDFDQSYRDDIPKVIAGGVNVTVYNGDLDIICNYMGEADLLDSMPWAGQSAFNSATNQTWTVSGKAAGTYRTAQMLTFVRVFQAGHMVPLDQPRNALDLIDRIIAYDW